MCYCELVDTFKGLYAATNGQTDILLWIYILMSKLSRAVYIHDCVGASIQIPFMHALFELLKTHNQWYFEVIY